MTKDTWIDVCGDGKKYTTDLTFWDDGNTSNNDGWSSNWSIEAGWEWSGGNSTTKDTWIDKCGDGNVVIPKSNYWDDGNTKDNDGWSSNWSIENGWVWSGGNSKTKDTWIDKCGDGKVVISKSNYWDDGNITDNDGCSSNWSIENGWIWSGGNSTTKDVWIDMCGDGKKYSTDFTFWDDGNTKSNDGWNSNWSIEVGWIWTDGNSTTKDVWIDLCGDGRKFNSNSNYWDDRNLVNSDGCSSNWNVEKGWNWSGGSTIKADTWVEVCGDGIRFNTNSTYWDDGNINDGDGWNSICTVESNWKWSGGDSNHKDEWRETINQGKKYLWIICHLLFNDFQYIQLRFIV